MSDGIDERHEWLEADGLGGFASGTTSGIRTRRYHGLLLSAASPPTGRQLLVAGFDAGVEVDGDRRALSSQRYAPDVIHPDGAARIEAFSTDPWPRWTYRIDDDFAVEQSIVVPKGLPVTIVRWRVTRADLPPKGGSHEARADAPAAAGFESDDAGLASAHRRRIRLCVRPFFAGRDYHTTHHENGAFRFDPAGVPPLLTWQPYDGVLGIRTLFNGSYRHQPDWYRRFEYTEERARGLDPIEDLASPGEFEWDLSEGDALLLFGADTRDVEEVFLRGSAVDVADSLSETERQRRAGFARDLDRSADAYIVRRGSGSTIVAGYPWFTDWGRDTFIALRGLTLATGRLADARQILLAWSGAVSEGMLPNRFPDAGEAPEFNAVDASLWFIVAAHELLEADETIPNPERSRLFAAIEAILDGYSRGTRFGIHADADGLLAAGVPGTQLTWMDARVHDREVTPRIGKPIEVQALWVNALWIASRFSTRWTRAYRLAHEMLGSRFWNEDASALYDVIDVDHVRGTADATFRPNQIFAVGGLPLPLIEGDRARAIVDAVERRLWTPLGLRTLAPGEPGYVSRFGGDVAWRDGAYHQGTAWPWLIGAFAEAWVRTRGSSPAAIAEARRRFLEPLLRHLGNGGLGHLPEVADGDEPHTPGGCPFQAWSLGEALRLDRIVLAARAVPTARRKSPRPRTGVIAVPD